MKHILRSAVSVAACVGLILTTNLRADETWNGGNGTWDFNTTPSWNGGSPWTSNTQVPDFNTTPGTVTVDDSHGQVGAYFLYFNSSSATSTWDIKGDPLAMSIAGGGNNLLVLLDGNSGNVAIDSAMNVDTSLGTDRYNIFSNSTSALSLNGNITLGAQTLAHYDVNHNINNARSLIIGSNQNSAVFYLNGTFSDSTAGSTEANPAGVPIQLRLAEGGATQDTYFINGDVSGMHGGVQIGSGNMVVNSTANLGTGTLGMYDDQDSSSENVAIYGAQGRTITNDVYISMKYHSDGNFGNGTLGAYDASNVTFAGNVGLDNSGAILTAASGGRATFTADINNHSPNGLVKTGAGTVVLARTNGTTYTTANEFTNTSGPVAMDIQQGTLLINNITGNAFGGSNGKVKVEAGATLGGSGNTGGTHLVEAEGATSVIAPGDAGQASLGIAPSIATLTLSNGLTTTNSTVVDPITHLSSLVGNGLTLAFKLGGMQSDGSVTAGVNNDYIIAAGLTLSGPITVNFTALGTVATATPYTLMTGTGNWTDTGAVFDINAPAGYTDDLTYGASFGTPGYIFDAGGDNFSVQFVATPEPSTYGLLGLGLLSLVAIRRFRKLGA